MDVRRRGRVGGCSENSPDGAVGQVQPGLPLPLLGRAEPSQAGGSRAGGGSSCAGFLRPGAGPEPLAAATSHRLLEALIYLPIDNNCIT